MENKKDFEIGRVCEKTEGKEKGKICVVVEQVDSNMVVIDGDVKRRRCNIAHLMPLEKTIKIKKGEKSEEIKKELEKEGFSVAVKKTKLKERLRKHREEKRESGKEEKKAKKK